MSTSIADSKSVKYAFSDVLDKAVMSVYKNKSPVAVNKHEFVIGDLEIKYNNKLYSVSDRFTKEVLYKDIFLIEAAFLLAKYNQLKLSNFVKSTLVLEQQYVKHYLDMQSYSHICAVAKKNKDYDRIEIAEARYACSKIDATAVRDKLKLLCDKIIKKR